MRLLISMKHVARVKAIREAFPDRPKLPSSRAWLNFSQDDVWLRIFTQVAVVGRAEPKERLKERSVNRQIRWTELSRMKPAVAARRIWNVLRAVGARYSGQSYSTCRKTAAVLRNLAYLKEYPYGPKGFISDVAGLEGPSTNKVAFVAKRLSFIKNKGARDLLTTGFGLVKDHIALDSRVVGALAHLGIRMPVGYVSNPTIYRWVECELLAKVCRPLRMTGAELDQLLFYNYAAIKKYF